MQENTVYLPKIICDKSFGNCKLFHLPVFMMWEGRQNKPV